MIAGKNLDRKAAGELVMPGRHRRVRGEYAHVSHAVDVELLKPSGETLIESAFEQPQRKQCRVPLVHVIGLDLTGIQLLNQSKAAKAQNNFLGQTITLVS